MRHEVPPTCVDRLGAAALTRMQVSGIDLRPLWQSLIAKLIDGTLDAGEGLDLALIAQLLGDKPAHLAIADRWDVWYLNAGMSQSASKRHEEETFMRAFDSEFARRHERALSAIAARIGLDYFIVDCAVANGSLLVFEVDNAAIVHDMDSLDLFPYKQPQMRKVFDAFTAMLNRRATQQQERAA